MSLAIGKEGQNARLAFKLTGWRIDIKSEEEKRKEVEAVLGALEMPADEEAAEGEVVADGDAVATADDVVATADEAVETADAVQTADDAVQTTDEAVEPEPESKTGI